MKAKNLLKEVERITRHYSKQPYTKSQMPRDIKEYRNWVCEGMIKSRKIKL